MNPDRRMLLGLGISTALLPLASAAMDRTAPSGRIVRHAAFQSEFVESRNVDVWLPPGYDDDGTRYPVIYMHDGQNVFDPADSSYGTAWEIDEVLGKLIAEKGLRPAIVVAIWNTGMGRYAEFMPPKAVPPGPIDFEVPSSPTLTREQLVTDRYLRFIVSELKPFIDATYRTRPARGDTFVMGSSMGGLVSGYAISEYPEVFGGAACVSTHWLAGQGAVVDYLGRHLPDPATHRLYFDFGTETLDAGYEPHQRRMDEFLRRAGYVEGRNWVTRKFDGAEHSERAWRQRVDEPLRFLLGPVR